MRIVSIIFIFMFLYGCAADLKRMDTAFTNMVMGDPAKRIAENRSKSSMDLCLGLVRGNTFADVKKEYGQELGRRNEDCSQFQAVMAAEVQAEAARRAAALNYYATMQQNQQSSTIRQTGTIICRNNYGTVICNY